MLTKNVFVGQNTFVKHLKVLSRKAGLISNKQQFSQQIFLFPKVIIVLYFRLWIMGGSMPLFSEQDNPASFSPYIITRSVEVNFLNFTWYFSDCFK